ncbi:hypothetical protein BH11ARM2_BH11ARM2_24020 [soil metagenome]
MGAQGVYTFTRDIRYRTRTITVSDGSPFEYEHGEEKGIDVRIAIDMIRLAAADEYDVALVFSQDQDLSEVANEVRRISQEQERWIKIACAYPAGSSNPRGIKGTDWIKISKLDYDRCLDPRDYRPGK